MSFSRNSNYLAIIESKIGVICLLDLSSKNGNY